MIQEINLKENTIFRLAHVVVDITILDLNDNPPVFVNLPYQAVVSKDATANSKIIQVTATDQDKGANSDIYYQLVRGNGDLFKVARTGVISLKKGLESYRQQYKLTIAAYDGGSPPYSVILSFLDMNSIFLFISKIISFTTLSYSSLSFDIGNWHETVFDALLALYFEGNTPY